MVEIINENNTEYNISHTNLSEFSGWDGGAYAL